MVADAGCDCATLHLQKIKRAHHTRRTAHITPSMFAGHSMLCPYDGKDKILAGSSEDFDG
jgi:hypothetical protein